MSKLEPLCQQLYQTSKKLAAILATSTSTTGAYKKTYIPSIAENSFLLLVALNIVLLKRAPYINYPLCFKKDQIKFQALLDFGSEINTMVPAYAANLGLNVRPINVGAQKIDSFTFKISDMALASFKVNNMLS